MKPCTHMITHRSFKAAVLIASLAWLLTLPLIGASPCGLRIPHDHILLGRVDPQQMRLHLAQEAACGTLPQSQTFTTYSRILSYVPTHSATFSTVTLILWVPAILAVLWLARFGGRLLLPRLFPVGIAHPPKSPPPRPTGFASI